jgi:6-pyruvoyltetrahydropterin/6-carboxytetrahydropterin synthase
VRVGRSYGIAAAHSLPFVPKGHKCGRLHGHNYTLDVEIVGTHRNALGWVLDFAFIDAIVEKLIVGELDHRHLNEIPGLENPTSEVILDWIWDRLSVYGWPDGVTLARVRLGENGRSWAERIPYEAA